MRFDRASLVRGWGQGPLRPAPVSAPVMYAFLWKWDPMRAPPLTGIHNWIPFK